MIVLPPSGDFSKRSRTAWRISKAIVGAAQDSGPDLASYLRASNTTGGVIRLATSLSTKLLRILATCGRLDSSLR